MSRYRIFVDDVEPKFPIESLKENNCFVGISLNNKHFAEKYIPDIFSWIGKHFNHCNLVIGDYVHRYNLQIFDGLSEESAVENALQQGNIISETIASIISRNRFTSFSLFRWVDKEIGINDVQVNDFKLKIKNTSQLMSDINQLSAEYLKKQISKNNLIKCTQEKAVELCNEYLMEEMFFINQMVLNGSPVSVYPGTQFQLLKNISAKKYPLFETALSKAIYIDLGIKK